MSEVWLSYDIELKDRIALKFLTPALSTSPAMVDLLRQECLQTRRLIHPNIVRVFDFHHVQNHYFISMEYIEGGDFRQFHRGDYKTLLSKVVPIVDALHYAHQQGIIHRDIKSSNILCDAMGNTRLTDFGIAAVLNGDRRTTSLRSGGSRYHMSPQQMVHDTPTPADDIYGLGVLLYESIAGHPPWYPTVTEHQIKSEPPPPISAPHPIAPQLETLIFRMLAKSPSDRPSTIKELSQQLKEVVTDEVFLTAPPDPPDSHQRPEVSLQNIRPVSLKVPPQNATPKTSRKNKVPMKVAWATIFLLVIMAVGIFYYLPQNIEDRLKPSTVITYPESSDTESPKTLPRSTQRTPVANIEPWQETQRLEARADAENALQAFIKKHATVEQKGVSLWAPQRLETAESKAAQGDEALRTNEFNIAAQFYTEGVNILDELIAKSGTVLESSLAAGYKALKAKDAASATSEFQLALVIDPGNGSAKKGLSRAHTLDEVLIHLESGYQHEKQGKLSRAHTDFKQALALDPEFEETQTALARVIGKITDTEFRQAMSAGFASLNRNEFQAAHKAFEKARQLKPQSAEPQDGLAQVTLNRRLQRIAEYRKSATSFAREEQWRAAAEKYQAALQIDPTLVFAKQGKTHSIARAELSEALDTHIKRPDRLSDERVLKNAMDLHANASSLADQGPRLRGQIANLAKLITMAQTPVRVRLESDNETNVVVYKVGQLGRFRAHDLALRPGTYTVVGTRDGYRDVRHKLTVIAGQTLGPVLIRCEEKI